MSKQNFAGRTWTGGWRFEHRRTQEWFGKSEAQFNGLRSLVPAISAQVAAIAANKDLTASGKARALRDWAKSTVQPQLRAAREVLDKSTAYGAAKRAHLAAKAPRPDPSDLAGALMRQDIRALWRAMPVAERVAKLQMGGLDPVVALALVEAPAELSGITSEQRALLTESAALATDPTVAEELGDLADAQQSVEAAARAVEIALRKDAGLTNEDLDEIFERPTFARRLADAIGDLPAA